MNESDLQCYTEYEKRGDTDLLREALDPSEDIGNRELALYVIINKNRTDVSKVFLSGLEDSEVNVAWRDQLVFASLHVDFQDVDVRERIAKQLYMIALSLRAEVSALTASRSKEPIGVTLQRIQGSLFGDSNEYTVDAVFNTALRRWASIVPEKEASSLLEFLREEDDLMVQHMAAICIALIFSVRPPKTEHKLDDLRAHVSELANREIAKNEIESSMHSAYVHSLIEALGVLGGNDFFSHAEQLARKFPDERFDVTSLEEIVGEWIEIGGIDENDEMLLRVRAMISQLEDE